MATIEKRGDSFRIMVSTGYDVSGKQLRKRTTWTPTPGMTVRQIKKELDRVAVEFENSVSSGQYVDDKNIRLAEFCVDFLEITKSTLAPRTLTSYKSYI